MGLCYYCDENERESYWKHYCNDCAMLRRMLVLHKPKECVAILKRCLIRDKHQIDNKIKREVLVTEIKRETKTKDNTSDYNLRCKNKKEPATKM